MTTPIHQSQDNVLRWTAQTVGMNVDILDRMARAVRYLHGVLVQHTRV
jgi:hypothetical protein